MERIWAESDARARQAPQAPWPLCANTNITLAPPTHMKYDRVGAFDPYVGYVVWDAPICVQNRSR